MNWNLQSEVPYTNTGVPYSSSGSFMDFFEGLTYEHVNFIFADPSYSQENTHPEINTNAYKFGLSEPASFSYNDYCHACAIGDHTYENNEYSWHFENSSTMAHERATAVHTQQDGHTRSRPHANSAESLMIIRCVICQMEYKRGDGRITLPCKHIYHAGCGSRWLSINKACPICYKEVHVQAPKR